MVNFLAHLFDQGYQYQSINAYRSAISSVHEKADGYEVAQHPPVSRLLKGVFCERPPQPRYSETRDVSRVTAYTESLGENDSLSLPLLTQNRHASGPYQAISISGPVRTKYHIETVPPRGSNLPTDQIVKAIPTI